MLIVFFLLGILAMGILLFVGSVIDIEICNIRSSSEKPELPLQACIYIRFYFLDRIAWFRKKIPLRNLQKKWKKIDIQKWEQQLKEQKPSWQQIKTIGKNLHLHITALDLEAHIGTESLFLTNTLVTLLATGISILLPPLANQPPHQYHYSIQPLYHFRNEYKLALHCIIQVKVVHIIRIIIKQVKERKGEKYERTSNTRVNDYSYE